MFKSWSSFQKTIGGFIAASALFLGIISILVGNIYGTMRGDMDELKRDTKELTKQVSETKLEIVRAVGNVATQAAATNARLDQLIADGRRR